MLSLFALHALLTGAIGRAMGLALFCHSNRLADLEMMAHHQHGYHSSCAFTLRVCAFSLSLSSFFMQELTGANFTTYCLLMAFLCALPVSMSVSYMLHFK